MAVEYVHLDRRHGRQAAHLHLQGISTGFLSSLGEEFLTVLYETMGQSEGFIGLAAVEAKEVIGFVAFAKDLSRMYRSVLRSRGLRLLALLARRLFSPGTTRRIVETLLYPGRTGHRDLPAAELLAIVVAPAGRGRGVATNLIRMGLKTCAAQGVQEVKVLVAADNEAANRLYRKCGFQPAGDINSHGVHSRIYVVRTVDSSA